MMMLAVDDNYYVTANEAQEANGVAFARNMHTCKNTNSNRLSFTFC